MESYIQLSNSLSNIEAFCDKYQIDRVPVLLNIVNGKKTMEDLSKYNLYFRNPKYDEWDVNKDIYQSYITNTDYWHKQIEEHTTLKFVWGIDTRSVMILDVDDVRHIQNKYVRVWLKNSPFFKSICRGLPKIFLVVDKMPPLKANYQIDTNLELHNGQWSYVDMNTPVYNGEENICHETFEDMCIYFPALNVKSAIHTSAQLSKSEDNAISWKEMEQLLNQISIEYAKDWKLWNDLCFNLKTWRKDSFELFDAFSQRYADKYSRTSAEERWNSQKQDADGWLGYFINLQKKHNLHIFRGEEETTSLLSNNGEEEKSDAQTTLQTHNREIKCILESSDPFKLQQGHFRQQLMIVMKNLCDTDGQFEVYKQFLEQYCGVVMNDILRGSLMKDWHKQKFIAKYSITYLRKITAIEPHNALVGRNYVDVKRDFIHRLYKILSPSIMYADIEDNGEVNFYTTKGIREKYLHISCFDEDDKKQSFMELYLRDPQISTVYKVDFNIKTKERIYHDNQNRKILNLFDGFYAEKLPIVTMETASIDVLTKFEKMQEFILHRLCDDNQDNYNYVINWLASIVQRREKTKVIIVIKGPEGCGKGMTINYIGNCIFGSKYYIGTAKLDHMVGTFNGLMMNKVFANANEIARTATIPFADAIKELIDNPTLVINRKGIEPVEMINQLNLIVTTNNDIPFKIPFNERRFFAIETSSPLLTPKEATYYGESIFGFSSHNKNNDLISLFYNHLSTIDLSTFNSIQDRPFTDFYKEMVTTSIPCVVLFLHYYMYENVHQEEKKIFEKLNNDGETLVIQSTVLYNSFIDWWRHFNNVNEKHMTHSSFGRRLPKIKGVFKKEGKSFNGYFFKPSLLIEMFKEFYMETFDDHTYVLSSDSLPPSMDNIPAAKSLEDII